MHPAVTLDHAIVTSNVRAWRAFAGVPVRGVVKGDGYGWGYRVLVDALEGEVDAFCVADADELRDLRRHTATRAIVLGDVPLARLAEVMAHAALANVDTPAALTIAEHHAKSHAVPLRVRLGVRPAAAWSGLSLDEIRSFAPLLAQARAHVEVWSHITDWQNRDAQQALFSEAVRVLRAAQVDVVDTEIASTLSLAADGALGSRVRIGIGLFGAAVATGADSANGAAAVSGLRCALRVVAPITRTERVREDTRVGYGTRTVDAGTRIATARCGYGDGLPAALSGYDGIISVGMQYVTVGESRIEPGSSHIVLLDETTNLDALAARAGRSAHEIVTAFGNAASARAVRHPPA